MFQHLLDFDFKRSGVQALGFYIAWLVLITLVGALLGAIGGMINPETAYQTGVRIGTVMAIVASVALCGLIIQAKKRITFPMILLAVFSGFLAFLGGGVLGLIPAAYLTTLPVGTQK